MLPTLFNEIRPELTNVPPMVKVVLLPTRIVPALAPEPVPAVAMKSPPMIDRGRSSRFEYC